MRDEGFATGTNSSSDWSSAKSVFAKRLLQRFFLGTKNLNNNVTLLLKPCVRACISLSAIGFLKGISHRTAWRMWYPQPSKHKWLYLSSSFKLTWSHMQEWTIVTCANHSISCKSIIAGASEGPIWVGALSILVTRGLLLTFINIWRSKMLKCFSITTQVTARKSTQGWGINWPVQLKPSPLYPALQVQVKEPGVLTQLAFGSQGNATSHSTISAEYELQ